MGSRLKIWGWIGIGAVAGALATMQLQASARSTVSALPIEELQQLAAVFGMVKSDYVETVDEKKLITDAIGGMVAGGLGSTDIEISPLGLFNALPLPEVDTTVVKDRWPTRTG